MGEVVKGSLWISGVVAEIADRYFAVNIGKFMQRVYFTKSFPRSLFEANVGEVFQCEVYAIAAGKFVNFYARIVD